MSDASLKSKLKPEQIPMDWGVRAAYDRADFLVGRSNQEAVGWIDRWPNWPAPLLILSGPAASGKTHLAAVWQKISRAEHIRADMLISRSAEDIAKAGEHLLFDGLDPWIGDEDAERTLFHIYNILKESQRTMMVTMRMTSTESPFVIADLASRFRAAPLSEIKPPDDLLLGSVLIKLFVDRQLTVSNDVIAYILPRMERSFSAARDLVAMADRLALSEKRGISIPLMRKVLSDLQDH